MKKIISILILFIALTGCKNTTIKGNNEHPENLKSSSIISGRFDSLYRAIECETENIQPEILSTEKKIDSLFDETLLKLTLSKKDTIFINPLKLFLEKNRNGYRIEISNKAELLFWSYGVSSMQGERRVARDCYYLYELRKRYQFLLAINEKIHGTLLDL